MYSQNHEDDLIKEYFGDYKGVLLSLGENDGQTLSNALLLIENGWEAVLVEPSPKAFERLYKLHEGNDNVLCLQTAIGTECGTMTLLESGSHLNCEDVSLLSTLVPEETKRWTNTEFTPVQVSVIDVETLLKVCPEQIDFISIDCEGVDLDILKQFDFKSLGTQLVCVEWNSKDKWAYDHVMLQQGFSLLHTNAENLIYVVDAL